MSSGYAYGEDPPTIQCPYCEAFCDADFVDIGVGMIQCGPYTCDSCHATQIGPYDEKRELTKIEAHTGWYEPNSIPGSSANVIHGHVVTHKVMEATYRHEFINNPLYEDRNYVKDWWNKISK